MRRFAAIGLLVLSMLVMAASAGAARAHKHPRSARCQATTESIVADAQADVYYVARGHGFAKINYAYGCAYGHGGSYALGAYEPECLGGSQAEGACGGVGEIVLAGAIVAYDEFSEKVDQVFVRDLRSGRLLHKVPTGTRNPPRPSEVGVGPTTAIVVKTDGAVAWIVETRLSTQPPAEFEVHALDKTGSRLLAAGANVDPNSLALAGSTLYWTQGGKPASAVLN